MIRVGKILVLDQDYQPAGKYPPAICRRLLRLEQARVHSHRPFVLVLACKGAKGLSKF